MNPATALAELRGLSTQIVEAVIVDATGTIEATSTSASARADVLARVGRELLGAAAAVRPGVEPPSRVEIEFEHGGLFVVRESRRTIVATTVVEPTAGLVVYDLRTALRSVDASAEDVER